MKCIRETCENLKGLEELESVVLCLLQKYICMCSKNNTYIQNLIACDETLVKSKEI